MLIKKSADIKSNEITDQKVYLNRRLFMRGAVLAGSVTATGLLYRKLNPPPAIVEERPKIAGLIAIDGEYEKPGCEYMLELKYTGANSTPRRAAE